MDHEKLADTIAKKYSDDKADKSASDEKVSEAEEKEVGGGLGKTAIAAIKAGDGEAFEEAVCRILEKHGAGG